jgi:hypothetical protein
VTTRPQQPADGRPRARSPLKACLIALAGTPDDASWIDSQLVTIAQLSADLIAPVAYASITAYRDDAVTTVAASSEIAIAIDQAQYDDDAGPCLDAVDTGSPVSAPDVTAAMRWPGFRRTAYQLGVTASLSIPLFAGSGTAIAGLNLYGRVPGSLAALTAAVWLAYDPPGESGPDRSGTDCDEGGEEMVAGLVGAFSVRAGIQQAIGVIMANTHRTADAAYLILRLRAAETGASLADTAAAIVAEQQW